jgi:hypothetical protein
MFRRGGSTSGITTGLRQGYKHGDVATGAREYVDLVESLAPSRGIGAGNEFLMNLGLNLVSNPPSGNILQTLGTEAKEPFHQFQQTRRMETAGRRDLVVAYLNTLDDDERTRLAKEVDYLMETDPGRFPDKEAALLHLEPEFVRYRKDQSPEESAREAKERLVEDLRKDPISGMGRWDELTAVDIATAWEKRPEKDSEGKPYDYDTQLIAIDEDDVNDMDVDIETEVMTIRSDKPKATYTDGTTYFDYRRKKWYTYQNGKFLPVNPS